MTAIFLSFQSQGWHTNDNGDLIDGATGAEAPAYDFSKGDGALSMPRRGRLNSRPPIVGPMARARLS
jgi:hypothetical protein